MPDSAKILKFLATIRDLRASATRSRIAYIVWGGRRGTGAWNAITSDPQMAGAIVSERYQRPGRKGKCHRGRPALRYKLTPSGRKILRDLLRAQTIAQETARKAAKDAQEDRQAEIRRVAEEKLQAAINARPKYPSKGRQRSAKDIADRLAWRRRTFKNEVPEPSAPVPFPVSIEPQDDNRDWWRYVSAPTRLAGFVPPMQTTPVDSKSQALLARIAQAGYRVKDGRVLYGGSQWIAPEEWRAKMPHVEL
jgi:hypothetical protein